MFNCSLRPYLWYFWAHVHHLSVLTLLLSSGALSDALVSDLVCNEGDRNTIFFNKWLEAYTDLWSVSLFILHLMNTDWMQIVYDEQWFSWRGKKCLPLMSCILQVIFLSVRVYWGMMDKPIRALRKQEVMSTAITLTMLEEPQALSASLGDLCNI